MDRADQRMATRVTNPASGQRSKSRGIPLLGPSGRKGFDFTWAMRRLVQDMTSKVPELRHIDLPKVAIAVVQTRVATHYGVHATLTPMRFENGSQTTRRRGKHYTVQRLYDERGREMMYILSFYLPRFMSTDFQEKMVTIFHELWHISPKFNGDIRRHPGRCYAHSSSQKEYDAQMAVLVNQYLLTQPDPELYRFLEYDCGKLAQKFGPIHGVKIPRPKLLPVAGG